MRGLKGEKRKTEERALMISDVMQEGKKKKGVKVNDEACGSVCTGWR